MTEATQAKEPWYMAAARKVGEYLHRVRKSKRPTRFCLSGEAIQRYAEAYTMTSEHRSHVADCDYCARFINLVDAVPE